MKSFFKKTLILACMSLFMSSAFANEPMTSTSEGAKPAVHHGKHKKVKKASHCKCKKVQKHHKHKMHHQNKSHESAQPEGSAAQ